MATTQPKDTQKLLFICSRNQWRSPTAEGIFKEGFLTRSAGTSLHAKNYVSIDDVKWADVIFVMENKHKSRLTARFTRLLQFKKIHVLDIEDNYHYMDEELIAVLKKKITQFYSQLNSE